MGEPKWITYDAVSGVPELTATELRQIEAAYFEGPAGGQAYSGVRYGTGLVSLAGTTITYQALNFVIQGVATSTGAYVGFEPQGTFTLSPAHATLARTDRVWVEVQDHEADASNQRRSRVVYATGTPGGAAATLPTTATLLAEINVPINNTAGAVVTDRRTYYNAPPDMLTFTGNGTWTKPANLKAVRVWVVGGGGGGGAAGTTGTAPQTASAGGGGGGGGYSYEIIPASALGATVAVTVGTGGAGGVAGSGAVAGSGGTSSFGASLSATGGAGAPYANAAQSAVAGGGAGGNGSGGTVNAPGQTGDTARWASAAVVFPGTGGNSAMGFGAPSGASIVPVAGVTGTLYGGGGSGAIISATGATSSLAGGAGAAGVVIIEHIYR